MPHLYQTADAFSLASPMETFGLVFLEALACGLPVVAHDGPRQRFVVGETGFFCDVHDSCSFAEALRQALQSPPDIRRRAHAETFQWDRILREYQKVFASLVS
jgi:glycosyltransferase involved in cell wall biosynthesis